MENTNFYNKQNLIEIKNTSLHKKGQIAVAPIEAVAFFMIASASLVNNPTNYVNPNPKQQIIQNVQEKGDVDMSNNKDTSTQEIRQKDLDSLKEIEEAKINGLDDKFEQSEKNIKDIINKSENNINKRIDALNTRIDDLTKTMDRDLKIVAGVLTLAIAAATFIIKVL